MEGKWVKLEQKGSIPGARSSHAVAVVGKKAYVFGGELTPRVPVDNKLHVFDLEQHDWSIAEVVGDIPPPRVGVTMTAIGNIIYVFGGRDADHKELNELFSFDTRTNEWFLLSSDATGMPGPPHRSYHSMTADDDRRIYIFGGCGNAGRLNDLWAYDTSDHEWIQFSSPGEQCRPRGGPGLSVSSGKVWVVYGFSGTELDDVHSFDLVSKEWSVVDATGEKPCPRSVFSTVSIGKHVLIYGGEIDPSDLGHLGAGKFAGEVYALDTETCAWSKVSDAGENPGRRGWCAFSAAEIEGEEGLFVYGGNSPTNDRLEDIFFFVPCL